MKTKEETVASARELAAALTLDMMWSPAGDWGSGYWTATSGEVESRIRSRAAAGLEFLRVFAGPDSFWTTRAVSTFDSSGGGKSMETGARGVGELLDEWANGVEAGRTAVSGEAASAQMAVSTDIMGQVRALIEDKAVHPAAPIVLCGAALEVALRGAVEAHGVEVRGRPSMASYAEALRTGGLFTPQDIKDVTAAAGLRNAAAHGEFSELSKERAGLMEQQTNILLRRIDEVASNG